MLTTERHVLDEPNLHLLLPRHLHEIDQFLLVEVSHHDDVELGSETFWTEGEGCFERFEDGGVSLSTGDEGEFGGDEGVETGRMEGWRGGKGDGEVMDEEGR